MIARTPNATALENFIIAHERRHINQVRLQNSDLFCLFDEMDADCYALHKNSAITKDIIRIRYISILRSFQPCYSFGPLLHHMDEKTAGPTAGECLATCKKIRCDLLKTMAEVFQNKGWEMTSPFPLKEPIAYALLRQERNKGRFKQTPLIDQTTARILDAIEHYCPGVSHESLIHSRKSFAMGPRSPR